MDIFDSGKEYSTLGKVLFEAAKTGNSRPVSIAHSQPAAPKLERGGATLARALDDPQFRGREVMILSKVYRDEGTESLSPRCLNTYGPQYMAGGREIFRPSA